MLFIFNIHLHYSHCLISVHLSHFCLKFSTAVTGQYSPYITVRDGDEANLSCKNVTNGQEKCDRTTWLFNHSTNTAAVELIERGQIGKNAKAKSDSVTANCSLVIKNVTVEDAGLYTCKQFGKTRQQGRDSLVDLSVVSSEYLHHNVFRSN